MAKKSKRSTKAVKVTKKATSSKRAISTQTAPGLGGVLFRKYDNNIAFTMIVSCAAYALFLAVSFVLNNTESVLAQQEQQIAAMVRMDTQMGQVAGVATEK